MVLTKITRLNAFKKDFKKMMKRGKNIEKLNIVLQKIFEGKTLDVKYNNHKLIGKFRTRFECHIEPDWLLVYRIEGDELILERMGTHSDLFK